MGAFTRFLLHLLWEISGLRDATSEMNSRHTGTIASNPIYNIPAPQLDILWLSPLRSNFENPPAEFLYTVLSIHM